MEVPVTLLVLFSVLMLGLVSYILVSHVAGYTSLMSPPPRIGDIVVVGVGNGSATILNNGGVSYRVALAVDYGNYTGYETLIIRPGENTVILPPSYREAYIQYGDVKLPLKPGVGLTTPPPIVSGLTLNGTVYANSTYGFITSNNTLNVHIYVNLTYNYTRLWDNGTNVEYVKAHYEGTRCRTVSCSTQELCLNGTQCVWTGEWCDYKCADLYTVNKTVYGKETCLNETPTSIALNSSGVFSHRDVIQLPGVYFYANYTVFNITYDTPLYRVAYPLGNQCRVLQVNKTYNDSKYFLQTQYCGDPECGAMYTPSECLHNSTTSNAWIYPCEDYDTCLLKYALTGFLLLPMNGSGELWVGQERGEYYNVSLNISQGFKVLAPKDEYADNTSTATITLTISIRVTGELLLHVSAPLNTSIRIKAEPFVDGWVSVAGKTVYFSTGDVDVGVDYKVVEVKPVPPGLGMGAMPEYYVRLEYNATITYTLVHSLPVGEDFSGNMGVKATIVFTPVIVSEER